MKCQKYATRNPGEIQGKTQVSFKVSFWMNPRGLEKPSFWRQWWQSSMRLAQFLSPKKKRRSGANDVPNSLCAASFLGFSPPQAPLHFSAFLPGAETTVFNQGGKSEKENNTLSGTFIVAESSHPNVNFETTLSVTLNTSDGSRFSGIPPITHPNPNIHHAVSQIASYVTALFQIKRLLDYPVSPYFLKFNIFSYFKRAFFLQLLIYFYTFGSKHFKKL